ncbi:hypothetical protein LR48_Vigan05g060200 [Vigna angularis]|uniref:Uncharacterized protein n=1 Tax=Phaseolus angularis TaxID=3914 RepID=A0A0L9UJS6_PHAAN|nr:hypothetical protein LR48_Vigan05g060200 [Vigna angularis]
MNVAHGSGWTVSSTTRKWKKSPRWCCSSFGRDTISVRSSNFQLLKKTVNGWFFIEEQTVGSPPTLLDQDRTEDSDDEDSLESS